MGVRLHVDGLLLAVEHRPAEAGSDGSGFVSGAVLPEGSRETLEFWSFDDNAAARHILGRFSDEGLGAKVSIEVDLRAKSSKSGAYLSSQLLACISPDGEAVTGRVPAGVHGFDGPA